MYIVNWFTLVENTSFVVFFTHCMTHYIYLIIQSTKM